MVDTVPTAAEDSGDFSQSGVNIYDPNSTTANPNYNPSLPASKSNPQYIRQQFSYNGVFNVIPPNRLTKAASIMLNQYTPCLLYTSLHGLVLRTRCIVLVLLVEREAELPVPIA